MAIKIGLNKTERILFCGSKWWGDPDMPDTMQYPMASAVDEDGWNSGFPLTFICQINCEDIAPYDKDGLLPHEGMLYFFGAIDELLGYESLIHNPAGEWGKGSIMVKYARTINFETFQSCILMDDEGQPVTDAELEMTFSECEDEAEGFKILGVPPDEKVRTAYPECRNLLQICFDEKTTLHILIKESDLKYGNWKKAIAFLQSE